MVSFLPTRSICLVVLLVWTTWCTAQAIAPVAMAVSEQDFLTDMPIVLSVSRLPQRLDDAPGAVTIIDRDTIRLSGARDVVDLLRLVPGFQTSNSFERSAPQASYHGSFGSISNRIQVLVDGRSVYSPYFIGSTEYGLQTVALEDIDRIEVLRGSNSAAYGARAFLGVINIITRDTVDTVGLHAGVTAGQNDVRDARASVGWGTNKATFRLGIDRRADAGLNGSNGHNQVNRVNFRSDLRSLGNDEIELRAGGLQVNAGKGFAGNADDLLRTTAFHSEYAQLDWRRSLGENEDLALNFSHAQESNQDAFPYSLIPLGINDSIEISASGKSASDSISLQHTFRRDPALRMVWGSEMRREQVTSRPAYNTDAALVTEFFRLFGNVEWMLSPRLLLNAGAMAERNSVSGSNLAPRLMLNWHLNESQTLRAGVSRAFRPPSTFEKFADVRYIWNGNLLAITNLSSGNVQSENIAVRELGYLGDFPGLKLNLDVRIFHEHIDDFIRQQNNGAVKDYVNADNLTIRGLEYQLKWQPWRDAQVIFNQAFADINTPDPGNVLSAPKLATSLTYLQKMPGGLDFSLLHQRHSAANLQGTSGEQYALKRTDLRLGLPMRFERYRGELALVLQNLGSPYQDFYQNFLFQRRAFVNLRLDN